MCFYGLDCCANSSQCGHRCSCCCSRCLTNDPLSTPQNIRFCYSTWKHQKFLLGAVVRLPKRQRSASRASLSYQRKIQPAHLQRAENNRSTVSGVDFEAVQLGHSPAVARDQQGEVREIGDNKSNVRGNTRGGRRDVATVEGGRSYQKRRNRATWYPEAKEQREKRKECPKHVTNRAVLLLCVTEQRAIPWLLD